MICAEGADHVQVPGAADASHICTERLCDLDGEGSHASRRAVDQHFLPGLNLSLVAKTLQRSQSRHRHCRCLFECKISWFQREFGFASTYILRESGAVSGAEHFVAWFELGYVLANRFDFAGKIDT